MVGWVQRGGRWPAKGGSRPQAAVLQGWGGRRGVQQGGQRQQGLAPAQRLQLPGKATEEEQPLAVRLAVCNAPAGGRGCE